MDYDCVRGAARDKIKQIVDRIERNGGQVIDRDLDTPNPSDHNGITKPAKGRFGGVDVFFLNAEIMSNSPR